jgi:hypothetical protein
MASGITPSAREYKWIVYFGETPKALVMDLLPGVRADRCWDAFSADSSDTPPRGSA